MHISIRRISLTAILAVALFVSGALPHGLPFAGPSPASAAQPPTGAPSNAVEVPYTIESFISTVEDEVDRNGKMWGWCSVEAHVVMSSDYVKPDAVDPAAGVVYMELSSNPGFASGIFVDVEGFTPWEFGGSPSQNGDDRFPYVPTPGSATYSEAVANVVPARVRARVVAEVGGSGRPI